MSLINAEFTKKLPKCEVVLAVLPFYAQDEAEIGQYSFMPI